MKEGSLKGKIAVISGGASWIGKGISSAHVKEGIFLIK